MRPKYKTNSSLPTQYCYALSVFLDVSPDLGVQNGSLPLVALNDLHDHDLLPICEVTKVKFDGRNPGGGVPVWRAILMARLLPAHLEITGEEGTDNWCQEWIGEEIDFCGRLW